MPETATELGLGGRVAIGWTVMTRDGRQLGTVKEIWAGYFKVDAPHHPDYWLQAQAVESSKEGQVWVEFNQDALGDYQVAHMAGASTRQ
jgi:hypothetical protein